MLITILAFLFAIVFLVSLHELGHLVVARLLGVKVTRFSVGVGKPFYKKVWRGIEWCIAPLPLGGYVKMVDTREGEIPEEDKPYAFDLQHPIKKMLIVLAGPFVNLAIAVILGWFVFFHYGIQQIDPVVGSVLPDTVAERAGFMPDDKIVSVNGEPAGDNMSDAMTSLLMNLDAGDMNIVVDRHGKDVTLHIDRNKEKEAIMEVVRGRHFGLVPQRIVKSIGYIQPRSAADKAGFKKGDDIIKMNGAEVATWHDITEVVRANPGKLINVELLRDGKPMSLELRPESVDEARDKPLVGKAGFGAAFDEKFAKEHSRIVFPGVAGSLAHSFDLTGKYSWLTLSFFGKMITGNASFAHLSGPVMIADIAGKTAMLGMKPYLEFLILISISLGIMNLIPIPVLDGGQFVMYFIEWVKGRPLSVESQLMGFKVGWGIMLIIFAIAMFNDIIRLTM